AVQGVDVWTLPRREEPRREIVRAAVGPVQVLAVRVGGGESLVHTFMLVRRPGSRPGATTRPDGPLSPDPGTLAGCGRSCTANRVTRQCCASWTGPSRCRARARYGYGWPCRGS